MAKIKAIAGNFMGLANNMYVAGTFILTPQGSFSSTKYDVRRDVREIYAVDEKSGVAVGGAIGWGAVGAAVAGPAGAIVGGLLGGKGKKTVFTAVFSDSRQLMGEIDSDAWNKILAARMGM